MDRDTAAGEEREGATHPLDLLIEVALEKLGQGDHLLFRGAGDVLVVERLLREEDGKGCRRGTGV